VSVSVNLPLHHKVKKFSSGTGSPGWSRKKGRIMVVVGGGLVVLLYCCCGVHYRLGMARLGLSTEQSVSATAETKGEWL